MYTCVETRSQSFLNCCLLCLFVAVCFVSFLRQISPLFLNLYLSEASSQLAQGPSILCLPIKEIARVCHFFSVFLCMWVLGNDLSSYSYEKSTLLTESSIFPLLFNFHGCCQTIYITSNFLTKKFITSKE